MFRNFVVYLAYMLEMTWFLSQTCILCLMLNIYYIYSIIFSDNRNLKQSNLFTRKILQKLIERARYAKKIVDIFPGGNTN